MVGESVSDFIKKREEMVKNETKENDTKVEESDKVDNKESDPETNREESGSVLFKEEDISENKEKIEGNEIHKEVTPVFF